MQIEYAKMLKWFQHNHRDKLDRFIESVSPNQIISKRWLVAELEYYCLKRAIPNNYDLDIEIIGGWFGYPFLQYISHLPINSVRNIDVDPFAIQVFQKYVEFFDPDFECVSVNENIQDLRENNAARRTRCVINTSCEHMPPLPELVKDRGYIPEKVVFFLQSNNMFGEPDHVNCVNSVNELVEQSGITEIYYNGEKDMGEYKRFMVVGKWR